MSVIVATLPAHPLAVDGFFDLSLIVTSQGVDLTGVDLGLSITGAELVSRDLAGSDFPDPISLSLNGDLGGSVTDVLSPLGDGVHLVSRMHFRVTGVAASVVPEPFMNTVGYATGAPLFIEHPFDGFAGSVAVVPEPSTLAMGLVLLGCYVRWIIRKAVRR